MPGQVGRPRKNAGATNVSCRTFKVEKMGVAAEYIKARSLDDAVALACPEGIPEGHKVRKIGDTVAQIVPEKVRGGQ